MTAPGAVVFGSFDAERSWRPADAAVLPTVPDRQAARVAAGLDEVLAPVCGAGDLLVTRCAAPDALGADAVAQVLGGAGLCAPRTAVPGDPELGVEQRLVAAAHVLRPRLRGRRARPYALTGAVADACAALGMHLAPTPGHGPPDPAAVARVNAKTWSNDLVLERGFAGAARRVRSVRGLRDAAANLPVVVKDPYGVAGQGAIRVAERGTLDSVVRHLARQETRGREIDLLVQPLFAPGTDFSAHFAVDADGTPVFTGLCETFNDGFSYRGSRPMPGALAQRVARLGYLEAAEDVARAVAATGYRGPVCIDSMLTGDGTLVPVLEINARMSMGLVALSLARVLGPGGHGATGGTPGGETTDGTAAGSGGTVLRQRTVLPADARAYERLAEALRGRGLLAEAGRPGVLPLAAAPLVPPCGRLVYGLTGDTADALTALGTGLTEVLGRLGMLPPGGTRAD
ncbi:hypothetical protein OG216_11555 [Streptomycetaceae bacterium NBC_01309]